MKRKKFLSLLTMLTVIALFISLFIVPAMAAETPENPRANETSLKTEASALADNLAEPVIVFFTLDDAGNAEVFTTIEAPAPDMRVLETRIALKNEVRANALDLLLSENFPVVSNTITIVEWPIPESCIRLDMDAIEFSYELSNIKYSLSHITFKDVLCVQKDVAGFLQDGNKLIAEAKALSATTTDGAVLEYCESYIKEFKQCLQEVDSTAINAISTAAGPVYCIAVLPVAEVAVLCGVVAIICRIAIALDGEDALSDSVAEIRAMRICDIT